MISYGKFHIEQNLTPYRVGIILEKLIDGSVNKEAIAESCGLAVTVLERILLPSIRQLGLLMPYSFSLSPEALALIELSRRYSHFFPDSMHFLLYSLYLRDKKKLFSWSYMQVVSILWERAESPLPITMQLKDEMVGRVVEIGARTFDIPQEKIAFSRNSIRGALNWLQGLDPPVLEQRGREVIFRRRYFCQPVVFLWAIDFLYRISSHPPAYGTRLFLSPERVEKLCKICLMDLSGLENALEQAKRVSDYERGGVFHYGTEGGFGRWLLLARPCPVPSLPYE